MPRESGRKLIAQNRRARYDYAILDTLEAGLVLQGTEVKSLRAGRANLTEAYASIDNGEAWIHNLHIQEYTQGTYNNHNVRRKRKLLLHSEEIARLVGKTRESGLTIVPLSLYFVDGRAKVEIALARGKRAYDRRQTLAERDADREMQRAMGRRAKGQD
jgi:SsrA-binding protein